MAKDWFEYLKEVQDIAKAVPKNDKVNDVFYKACKEKLCNLKLQLDDTGYVLINTDIADHIIKQYQGIK
jgi:hypothetical protein